MSKNKSIVLDAYIASASEYDKYWSKFRAFMAGDVSEKARQNGAYESSDYKKGYNALRTPLAGSSSGVFYAYYDGTRYRNYSYISSAGLRVAFQLIYNPECDLVRGCEEVTRTALVYENSDGTSVYKGSGERREVTSTAPIITLANGTKCIWLNKEECESGKAKTMELWTLDLVDCAEAFDENGNHNNWGKAVKLQKQCKKYLDNTLSKEERAMVVPVEMSSEDDYETATPKLEERESSVKELFDAVYRGELTADQLRDKLKELVNIEKNKEDASAETAEALKTEIIQQTEILNKKLEEDAKIAKAKQEKKEKADAAFNDTLAQIESIKIGGEQE